MDSVAKAPAAATCAVFTTPRISLDIGSPVSRGVVQVVRLSPRGERTLFGFAAFFQIARGVDVLAVLGLSLRFLQLPAARSTTGWTGGRTMKVQATGHDVRLSMQEAVKHRARCELAEGKAYRKAWDVQGTVRVQNPLSSAGAKNYVLLTSFVCS